MAVVRSENLQRRDSTCLSFDIRDGWTRIFALPLVLVAEGARADRNAMVLLLDANNASRKVSSHVISTLVPKTVQPITFCSTICQPQLQQSNHT